MNLLLGLVSQCLHVFHDFCLLLSCAFHKMRIHTATFHNAKALADLYEYIAESITNLVISKKCHI